jgi:ABC-type phosphate/phosphonate transport system substrate-binding protein
MMNIRLVLTSMTAALIGLSACVDQSGPSQADYKPNYLGIETLLLDGDLVNFRVAMTGARNQEDVAAYARCAAAQYTLIRGFGFARHVRTNVAKTAGTWRADAVYTLSASLPMGLKTIDAEVTVRDCGAQGIPTV